MTKVLRSTDNPQFVNKNATISSEEHDNNFVEFQGEINEGRGLSAVKIYDNAKEYRLDEFVSYLFNIYKFISDVPTSGVLPDGDPTKWAISSMAEFLLDKNYIVATGQELSDLQQAGTLQKGRNYFIDDPLLFAARGYKITAYAAESDRLAVQGSINALVPDYQLAGDYTGVIGFVANMGVYSDTKATLNYDNLVGGPFAFGETITGGTSGATAIVLSDADPLLTLRFVAGTFINDEVLTGGGSGATSDADGAPTYSFIPLTGNVVVWDGRHYRKKTDTPTSTEPDADGTNYEVLPYLSTNGYILDTDIIDIKLNSPFAGLVEDAYDGFILKRADKRENVIYSPLLFQWGNDLVFGNTVHKGGVLECINTLQAVQSNDIYDGTLVANMTTNELLNVTQQLRGATVNVSGAETDREHDGRVFTTEIRIKAANVALLNSVRKLFIPTPGLKKGIEIISATGLMEQQGAGTPYDTRIDVEIIADTATQPLATALGILAATVDCSARQFKDDAIFGAADTQVMANEDIYIQVPGAGEPLNGLNDLRVFVSYRIVNMNC